jgi:hypothetical protein
LPEWRPSSPAFFYLDILQKHRYDWLAAAVAAVLLVPPPSWSAVRRAFTFWTGGDDLKALIGAWTAITLLVPTVLQTKLPWYLNPFYPMFALGVGWILASGLSRTASAAPRHHRALLVFTIAIASAVAEMKLIWYSYNHRALHRSTQHLLLTEGSRLRGTRVFRASWDRADSFVLKGLVDAEPAEATSAQDFLSHSTPGEYFLSSSDDDHPHLVRVAALGKHGLFGHSTATNTKTREDAQETKFSKDLAVESQGLPLSTDAAGGER